MSLYRVDKRELPVVLFLSDGLVREGVVFLSPYTYAHIGKQTLLDLFREPDHFLPFRDAHGEFCLVNKSAVTHVRYHEEPESGVCPLGVRVRVRMVFFGGETLEGQITLDRPEGSNRLLDYVNAAPGFFVLKGNGSFYIANGNLVREIAPLK